MRRSRARMPVAAFAVALLIVLAGAPSAAADVGAITEWETKSPGSSPLGIAPGPDGALWFAERGADRIGRITTSGALGETQLPDGTGPTDIALGPDGAMWFTEQEAAAIGRIEMDGTVTAYPVPTAGSMPTSIALGPDGAMWFTERTGNRIGRIAPNGAFAEYPIPTPASWPTDIALGPDGAMWFTQTMTRRIGRIAPNGTITEHQILGGTQPTGIVAGPDGALWFTAPGINAIGRITTAGSGSWTPIPTPSSNPTGIAVGPDGALWFTEQSGNKVARIGEDGAITEYLAPTGWSGPYGIAAGSDGSVWFTESSVSAVARLEVAVPDVSPPTITIERPADGAAFLVGRSVTASFACVDAGGSGLATCEGDVPDGAPLVTTAPGIYHFVVTATDGAGNTTTVEHDYVVFASWRGRLTLPPDSARLRAGQPADLRFSLGGDLGPVLAAGAPYAEQVDCRSGAPLRAAVSATAVGRGLRVSNGEYRFRWRTERSWSGTCHALVLPFTIQGGATVRLLATFV